MIGSLGIFIALLTLIYIVNLAAMSISRRGKSAAHHAAFTTGAIGICSIPFGIVGLAGNAMLWTAASRNSPAALLLTAGVIFTVAATIASALLLVKLRSV